MRKLLVITALVLFAGVIFGQTVEKGGTIGIHEWSLKLKPDVTMNQFLEFWESKVIPKMKKEIPEMTSLMLIGIGENNKDAFAGLYLYNSIEDFRKYWGEDGIPTEKGAAVMESYGPLLEELATFGEVTYVAKDWKIIK